MSRAGASRTTIVPASEHGHRQPHPELLHRRVAVEHEAGEDEEHDQRRRGHDVRSPSPGPTSRPGAAARPRRAAAGSGSPGTPRSPSRARTAQRTSSAARSSRSGTVPLGASSPISESPQPHWKTAVSTPRAAATESRLVTPAWTGTRSERKATHQQQEAQRDHGGDHDRQALRDLASRGPRCRPSSRPRSDDDAAAPVSVGQGVVAQLAHEIGRRVRRRRHAAGSRSGSRRRPRR